MSITNRKLNPSAVTLWRIQRGLRLVIVGIPMSTAAGIGLSTVLPTAAAVLIAGVLVLSQAVLALLWPTLEYEAFSYTVRTDDLLVQSGVIFKRWSSIPLSRIQHVDTRQGPLERMLGLSRLLVFTAAGMSADGSIPGLATDVAESMRDELSRRGGDDGV
jgi:membrane protein YdbS with pleckstrin-like domain